MKEVLDFRDMPKADIFVIRQEVSLMTFSDYFSS